MEKIEKWLKDNPTGSGDGSGDGSGYGYGSGSGDGYGSGSGDGYGSGSGSGYGYGSGSGSGDGYGSGYGSGSGDGSGYGYGSGSGDGYGSGMSAIDGKAIYVIDGIQTVIASVKDAVAKGFVLNTDLTMEPCFVAKGNGYFAHGKSVKEAVESLRAKIFENMDSTESIEEFMKKFKKGEKYKGTDFFEWHHYLTGSCLMGRESFVKNRGLDLEKTYTVDEFIDICEDDYGSEIIKELKEKWNE